MIPYPSPPENLAYVNQPWVHSDGTEWLYDPDANTWLPALPSPIPNLASVVTAGPGISFTGNGTVFSPLIISVADGASGTFSTGSHNVTVVNGVITEITAI